MYPHFNPRPPRGGRPELRDRYLSNEAFQSTPPARGATFSPSRWNTGGTISIHAPREGGDRADIDPSLIARNFNPRPPRGGRLELQNYGRCQIIDFNPRPPRGGRPRALTSPMTAMYFNPRPPRGGRPRPARISGRCKHFNPRPPRGGRQQPRSTSIKAVEFQSTPPARGATGPPEAPEPF